MNAGSLVGAVVAGIIGALIWGGITYSTGYEIGWVAWGVGLLVGLGGALFGGGSPTTGVVCAIVAAGSILAGKGLAIKFEMDKAIDEIAAEEFESYRSMASSFESLETKTDESYRQLLIDEGWVEATTPDDVPTADVMTFLMETVPFLEDIQAGTVDNSNWLESEFGTAWKEDLLGQVSIPEAVKESLGAMDILFGLLGVATAFKVGSGVGSED